MSVSNLREKAVSVQSKKKQAAICQKWTKDQIPEELQREVIRIETDLN